MHHAEIERLLPGVFQRTNAPGSPLRALLLVMEKLHAPSERVLEELPVYLDPRSADPRYLTMLAHWVDLDRVLPPRGFSAPPRTWSSPATGLAEDALRELVAQAARLAKLRGTAAGLRAFLEIASGYAPFRLEEGVQGADGAVIPFHVRVVAPGAAREALALIERITELEKPAYVTYEIVFEP
jgi:phage tail-like protein